MHWACQEHLKNEVKLAIFLCLRMCLQKKTKIIQKNQRFVFTAGCTINTTVQSVDHHCREGGTVNSPGSSNCTSPPCFCELGYNPQFVDFTSDITCVQAPCNPLVDTTGKCKCQYVLGAVSHDMTNCKCEPPYTSSSNNDGTCALECTAGEDHCKIASNNVTACTGTGCECRKGYYSIWDTVTGKYRLESMTWKSYLSILS